MVTALIAIFVENAVFARALGSTKLMVVLRKPRSVLPMGVSLTLVTTLSAVFAWTAGSFLKNLPHRYLWEPLAYAVCVIVVYLIVRFAWLQLMPKTYERFGGVLTTASLNCAVLGVVLLSVRQSMDLGHSIVFGIGSGIGFTFAMLLVREIEDRLMAANVPKAFKGLPITLLFVGILALALYGLVGHQLPT